MSTIKADNIATLAGVSTSMANAVNGSAKAWVNFNGTGTVAIRASFNVSSITDNGTALYTVNFANSLPDANYCATVMAGGSPLTSIRAGSASPNATASLYTPSQMQLYTRDDGGTLDMSIVCVAIHR